MFLNILLSIKGSKTFDAKTLKRLLVSGSKAKSTISCPIEVEFPVIFNDETAVEGGVNFPRLILEETPPPAIKISGTPLLQFQNIFQFSLKFVFAVVMKLAYTPAVLSLIT